MFMKKLNKSSTKIHVVKDFLVFSSFGVFLKSIKFSCMHVKFDNKPII
jgi:hypothetical protein